MTAFPSFSNLVSSYFSKYRRDSQSDSHLSFYLMCPMVPSSKEMCLNIFWYLVWLLLPANPCGTFDVGKIQMPLSWRTQCKCIPRTQIPLFNELIIMPSSGEFSYWRISTSFLPPPNDSFCPPALYFWIFMLSFGSDFND